MGASHPSLLGDPRAVRQPLTSSREFDLPPNSRVASHEEKLAEFRSIAYGVLDLAYPDRKPALRLEAKRLGLPLRDSEIEGILKECRHSREGRGGKRRGKRRLEEIEVPWIWDGLLIRESLNLLIAMPKVGKTSLLLGMISAWHRKEETFLQRRLIGPCPPVLIVGNDQPEADWCRMLKAAGLSTEINSPEHTPVVELWDSGHRLLLDEEGIEEIRKIAEENPGLFIVIDSVAATITALGIAEESPEIAEPLRALIEAVSSYRSTVVAIHHSSKGRAGEGAAAASRGSTALPALASQILKLGKFDTQPESNDRRLLLTAEGRGGPGQQLVLERGSAGEWFGCGDAAAVIHQQHLLQREHAMPERYRDALDVLRERTKRNERTTSRDLATVLSFPGVTQGSAERKALRCLERLVHQGFARDRKVSTGTASQREFWAIETARR